MIEGVPEYMIDSAEELQDAINYESKTNRIISTTRAYDGQPHTIEGDRGKTIVNGLTIRDICDCFVMGLLEASGDEEIYKKLDAGMACYNDVYRLQDGYDPIAAVQNAAVHIEQLLNGENNDNPPKDTQTIKDQEGNPLETILTFIDETKNKFPQCPALKVDSRGRVTIPEYTREVLGIGAGDYVDLVEIRKCK